MFTTRSEFMRTKLLTIGLLALSSSIAMAGRVQPAPVEVVLNEDGSGLASGNMATARAAANDVEFIGCGIRKADDGAGGANTSGFCQATNAAGVNAYCYTQNAELLDGFENVSDYSFITFAWNIEGQCTRIGVSTQSFYIP
jgi:hypothetical protein